MQIAPVYQSLEKDNCMQACLASIFDLPLNAVPHLPDFGEYWYKAMDLYVKSKGCIGVEFWELTPPIDGNCYITQVDTGKGHHVVIYKDGEMIHDPKPGSSDNDIIVGFYKILK